MSEYIPPTYRRQFVPPFKPEVKKRPFMKAKTIKPTKVRKLPFRYEDGSIEAKWHKFESKKGVTWKELRKRVAKYVTQNAKEGTFITNAYFGGIPLNGKRVDIKNIDMDKVLFDPKWAEESPGSKFKFNKAKERIHKYSIYIEQPVGGCDDGMNDCLHECIVRAFNGNPPKFEDPYQLKRTLKLGRRDRVPADKVPLLEKSLGVNIFINGDVNIVSDGTHMRNLYLNLRDHHYTLRHHIKRKIPKLKPPRPICLYQRTDNGVLVHDGKNYDKVTSGQLKAMRYDYKLVEHDEIAEQRIGTIEKHYENYVKSTERLRVCTDGKLDQRCWDYPSVGTQYLWSEFTYMVKEPAPIGGAEGRLLQEASHGAIIWGDQYEGLGWCYDKNSFYPAILRGYFKVPVTEGEWEHFDEVPQWLAYGIYRCEIESQPRCFKLIRYAKNNLYTHFDIKRALELGLKVTMSDVENNAYVWRGTQLVHGYILFKEYIDWLFKLRSENPESKDDIKEYANALWGALCQKNEAVLEEKDDEEVVIHKGREVTGFTDFGDKIALTVENRHKRYKTNWGRINPFILAQGRYIISHLIEPHIDKIVRVHTDGFIATEQLPIPLSNEIGGIKLEYQGERVKVTNANSVEIWDNIDKKWLNQREWKAKH